MNIDTDLITCNHENELGSFAQPGFFSFQDKHTLWSTETMAYSNFLEQLVFQITRKPKSLIAHVQRIYHCFHADLNEQLFAAIVDFLITLNKKGQAISWRIIMGTKSRLTSDQFNQLKNYLKDNNADINLLAGNQYSVFSRGFLGDNKMIDQIERQDKAAYDPLEIARDHIEYSQLKQAKQVLEKAILEQPTRRDLHYELLALYRSTRDSTGFNMMLAELIQSGVDIIDEWNQLNIYFKGLNGNG